MPNLPSFRPGCTATEAHRNLRETMRQLDRIQHGAVLWFGEIMHRELYRELGYATMRAYALEELGFSSTRAGDFIRLAARLEELPVLKGELAAGRLGYSQAREIIPVAAPENEQEWVKVAREQPRMRVREQVRLARQTAVAVRQANPAQAELMPRPAGPLPQASVPVMVTFEMSAAQYAHYETLLGQINHRGGKAALLIEMAEALLAAQECAVLEGELIADPTVDPTADPTALRIARRRATVAPFQVHIQRCPACAANTVATPRGEVPLSSAEVAATQCDAEIHAPASRNVHTIAPRLRREVLARDRHRCRRRGCDHTRHLHLHHVVPRARGGANEPANLVTLCAACHQLWHDRGGELREMLREVETG